MGLVLGKLAILVVAVGVAQELDLVDVDEAPGGIGESRDWLERNWRGLSLGPH